VIGEATVASKLQALPEPLVIAEREFAYACDIELESLAPLPIEDGSGRARRAMRWSRRHG